MRFISFLYALGVGAAFGFLPVGAACADSFTVQNGNDSGPGSLREAINSCNALGSSSNISSSILFAPGVTDVALQSTLPTVNVPLSLFGRAANSTTSVSIHPAPGAAGFRLMQFAAGKNSYLYQLHLSGGSADKGGLIYNDGLVTLDESVLESGTATQGGAAYNSSSGNLFFDQTTIKNNSATDGGGVYNAGLCQSASSTFSGNSAVRGGAVATYPIFDDESSAFFLTNSTMSGNTATQAGGGIYSSKSTVNLWNSTIAGNSAPSGAGAGVAVVAPSKTSQSSTVQIENTILAGNLALEGGSATPLDFSAADTANYSFFSDGYNLIGSSSGGLAFNGPSDRTGVTPAQLNLGELADNLGPTQTRALLLGSIAIDAGKTSLDSDQRGAGRNTGTAPDIGAYETPTDGDNAPIVGVAYLSIAVGESVKYQLRGSDIDGDALTFTILGGTLPAGLQLDNNTGLISGTPTQASGFAQLKYQVSDGHLTSKTGPLSIYVNEAYSLVVNTNINNAYDGLTSLYEALSYSQRLPSPGTITFDLPVGSRVVNLTSEVQAITQDVDIVGPTVGGGVTIQRPTGTNASKYRLFRITGGHVTFENLTFKDGDANTGNSDPVSSNGGAISLTGGQVTIDSCTFTGNNALQGGAISVAAPPSGMGINLFVNNSTFTGNSATNYRGITTSAGGAIAVASGHAIIDSCTLTGNSAQSDVGAALAAGSDGSATVEVQNSILAGNLNSSQGAAKFDIAAFPSPGTSNPFVSRGHNLAGISQGTGAFTAQGDRENVAAADLHLAALADNGGPTQTFAIQPNSPAFGKGATALTTDQRGQSRPSGAVDIGAFEAPPSAPPVISAVSITPNSPLLGETLTAHVTASDPDGTTPTLAYKWTRVRAGVSKVFATSGATFTPDANNFQPGDGIKLDVTASDEFTTVSGSAGVTLGNHPIVITSFIWQPKSPYSNEVMTATVKTQDLDKTLPSFTYTWKCNGVVTRTFKTRNVQDTYDLGPKGRGDKGDVIEVSVTATDGIASATAGGTAMVRNSAPVVSLLTLAPQSPKPTGTVTATYGGRDVDGDELQRTYLWRVGTKILKDEKGARVDLAKYPFVKAGDVVSVDLQLFDGEAYSKTLTAKVTVAAAAADVPSSPSS